MPTPEPVSRVKQAVADLSIRKKLFLSFMLLNLIPLALIGTLTYQISKSLIQENTNDYTTDILSEVSKSIELKLGEIDRLYYSIFTNPDVRTVLAESNAGALNTVDYIAALNRMSPLLYTSIIDRDDIESVHLFSLSGQAFHSGDSVLPFRLDVEDWNQIMAGKGDLLWLHPKGRPDLVAAVSSIYDVDNLKKIGYFVLGYRISALDEHYRTIKLAEQGELFILNREGRIFSHGDKAMINHRPDEAYIEAILSGGLQGNVEEEIGDRAHMITYRAIGETGWSLVSIIPAEKYAYQSMLLRNWMIVIMTAVLILAGILAYYLSNSIARPIRQLSEAMKQIERDRLDVSFTYNARNEIGILSRNFNRMIARFRYLINQVYEEELLKQRSQLKYLMFQINPHFLFNTLETINWLARSQGAPDVGKLSKALGDLMREGIRGKEKVTLDRELTNVNTYIYIQKYRFADKIEFNVCADPETLRIMVPGFILQPLVENALVHGLELKMGQGLVDIRCAIEGGELVLEVSDDGLGITEERLAAIRELLDGKRQEEESGIGLLNVHQRIRLQYGSAYGLTIRSKPGEGTVVQARLPQAAGPTGG